MLDINNKRVTQNITLKFSTLNAMKQFCDKKKRAMSHYVEDLIEKDLKLTGK